MFTTMLKWLIGLAALLVSTAAFGQSDIWQYCSNNYAYVQACFDSRAAAENYMREEDPTESKGRRFLELVGGPTLSGAGASAKITYSYAVKPRPPAAYLESYISATLADIGTICACDASYQNPICRLYGDNCYSQPEECYLCKAQDADAMATEIKNALIDAYNNFTNSCRAAVIHEKHPWPSPPDFSQSFSVHGIAHQFYGLTYQNSYPGTNAPPAPFNKLFTVEYGATDGSNTCQVHNTDFTMPRLQHIACDEGFQEILGINPINAQDHYSPDELVSINSICRSYEHGQVIAKLVPSASCTYGDPCAPGGGSVVTNESDYSSGTLQVQRNYNSLHLVAGNDAMGPGWYTDYAAHLIIPGGTNPAYVLEADAGGNIEKFVPQGSATAYRSVNAPGSRLVMDSSSQSWSLYSSSGRLLVFNGTGVLQSSETVGDPASRLIYAYGPALGQDGGLAVIAGEVAAITDAAGRSLVFEYAQINSGATCAQSGMDPACSGRRIAAIGLPDGSAISYTYDTAGNLASVTYPDGSGRRYAYNESADICPAALTNACLGGTPPVAGFPHLLTGITDVASGSSTRFATYQYDYRGRVVSSTDAGGANQLGLAYTGGDSVVLTFGNGLTKTIGFTTVAGLFRKQLSVENVDSVTGKDESKAYVYDQTTGRMTSTTDPRGYTKSYEYGNGVNVTAVIEGGDSGPLRRTETDWDGDHNVRTERRVKNASGVLVQKTHWAYNTRGQVLARCEVDPSVAGANAYICGAAVTAPTGVRQSTDTYCEQADVDAGVCPLVGLLLSSNGPRSAAAAGMGGADDITTYSYYQTDDPSCATGGACTHRHGDLWKKTDALGNVTQYLSYDKAGRLMRVKDANGTLTDLAYAPRGWLTDRMVRANADGTASAGDAITHMDYDAVGNVIKVTQPDGSDLAYTYDDAHRLIKMTDNLGNSIDYCPGGVGSARCLDAAGNRRVEEVKDPNGVIKRSVHHVYDQLSRLQQTLNAANQPVFDAANGYDGNGNLTHSVDGLGVMTQQQYDPLNRLITTIQDVGGTDTGTADATTHYSYDAADQLRSVTDPSGLTTTYTYNALGDLTQLDSPDTGTTTYTYDAAGNRTSQTDARGITRTDTYDALNRLVSTHYPDASLDVSYAYGQPNTVTGCAASSPKGQLTTLTDSTGSTTWCYDRRGNRTDKVVNVDGYTIHMGYSYDAADHLMSIDYGTGTRSVRYARDANGRIDTISTSHANLEGRGGISWSPLVTSIDYLPFGPATAYTFSSGGTLAKTYDQDYQISDVVGSVVTTGDALNLHFTTDAMGNITAEGPQSGVPAPDESYGYDAMNRLSGINPTTQPSRSFTYNPTGDRLSDTLAGSPAMVYAYAPSTHHLTGVDGTPRSVDAAGYTSAMDGTSLTYNDAGRMASVHPAIISHATNYTYNGLGQRVSKRAALQPYHDGQPTGLQIYTYLEDGRLAAEYREMAQCSGVGVCVGPAKKLELVHQYVWADASLVAVSNGIGAQETWSSVYTDHLGTPRAITDTAGTVVWRWPWTGNAFGEAQAQEDPDSDGTYFDFNLRYPGQYYDAETGLHYNYFRDYEPGTGRYVESDPIGLVGGGNTYAYVANNSVGKFDFNGLAPGDKWWEFTNRDFKRWYHQCWKQAGAPDATREDLAEAYAVWVARGSPRNGKCGGDENECHEKSPKSSRQSAHPKPNVWWYIGGSIIFILAALSGQAA